MIYRLFDFYQNPRPFQPLQLPRLSRFVNFSGFSTVPAFRKYWIFQYPPTSPNLPLSRLSRYCVFRMFCRTACAHFYSIISMLVHCCVWVHNSREDVCQSDCIHHCVYNVMYGGEPETQVPFKWPRMLCCKSKKHPRCPIKGYARDS